MINHFELPVELRQVQIVFILDDGQQITDHKSFKENYKHLFKEDKQMIINEIMS